MYSLIMTKVCSVDPELEIPYVEKYVNKAVILMAIKDRKKSSPAQSSTHFRSPRIPYTSQSLPTSDAPASAAHISSNSESSTDRPLEKDCGYDVPPST